MFYLLKRPSNVFKAIWSLWKDHEYRSLVILTLFALSSGTIGFHFVEGWRWLDSLYFSVISLTTVGYGDFSPKTDLGKMLAMFYLVGGIGILIGFVNAVAHKRTEILKANLKENE